MLLTYYASGLIIINHGDMCLGLNVLNVTSVVGLFIRYGGDNEIGTLIWYSDITTSNVVLLNSDLSL